MRIAHLSDIHFGRIAHPAIVEALVHEVNAQEVDLVVVSGDLTQRARSREYRAAAAMLTAFDPPHLVVPGNHDVYAWWYPFGRLAYPLRRYRRYISHNLMPSYEVEGLAVLGVNSAFGRTIKGGRIGKRARLRIARFFERCAPGTFKVLVVHHHLTQIRALGPHDVARNAQKTLQLASHVGVDLILCGHLHISHIEPVEIVPGEHPVVVASAGTATSNRGRGRHRQTNFYNLIDVESDHFTVRERRFDTEGERFVPDGATRFERLS